MLCFCVALCVLPLSTPHSGMQRLRILLRCLFAHQSLTRPDERRTFDPARMATVQEVNTPFGIFCNITLRDEGKESNAMVVEQTPTHVIIVLDRSGSMTGSRIDNAKKAVMAIAKMEPDVTVIAFHSNATLIGLQDLPRLTGGGGTCFMKAFQLVVDNMRLHHDTVIILMTDGETHDADIDGSMGILSKAIAGKKTGSVVCHSLGISNESTVHLLRHMAEAGTVVGTVQHIPDADGIQESVDTLLKIMNNETLMSITTKGGRRVVNNVLSGRAPGSLIINRQEVAVEKLPAKELVDVDGDTCYRILLTAVQEIAKEIRSSSSDSQKAGKRLNAAADLVESLPSLNQEEKSSLKVTIESLRNAAADLVQEREAERFPSKPPSYSKLFGSGSSNRMEYSSGMSSGQRLDNVIYDAQHRSRVSSRK